MRGALQQSCAIRVALLVQMHIRHWSLIRGIQDQFTNALFLVITKSFDPNRQRTQSKGFFLVHVLDMAKCAGFDEPCKELRFIVQTSAQKIIRLPRK
jgi:hypothetical protein